MQPFLRRILCADDDSSTIDFMRLWLAQQGYEVQTAKSKTEALRLAQEEPFDLYLLDDRFPDGYGRDLISPIRAVDPTTPIIIISGDTREVVQAEALRLGAQVFLPKPLDLDLTAAHIAELITAVEQLLPLSEFRLTRDASQNSMPTGDVNGH